MTFLIYHLIKLNREKKKRLKRKGRIYLLEDMILNVGQIVAVSFYPVYFLLYFDKIIPNKIASVVTALLIAFAFVIHYVAVIVLPLKMPAILFRVYPELALKY
ncbi:hypothetical protein [Zunongwangia sp.]|uniref:hypothetical protein n=1 Tax=Zunongwangia sp. TaxID=1965325 RepID=UPI003AA8324E